MVAMDWGLAITSAAVHRQNYKHRSQACPLFASANASLLQTKQPRPTPVPSNVAVTARHCTQCSIKLTRSRVISDIGDNC